MTVRKTLRVPTPTTVADVAGAALVAAGVGAYSWPAGLIVAGCAVLAGSWARSREAAE